MADLSVRELGLVNPVIIASSPATHGVKAVLKSAGARPGAVVMRNYGHGAGGGAFIIGDQVKGGMYGTYPSLKPEDLNQGDLDPNYDFRGFYSSVVDQWLGLDPVPIVGGRFEQIQFV